MREKKREERGEEREGGESHTLSSLSLSHSLTHARGHTDMAVDKATYPKLLGLEESQKRADALIAEAKEQLAPWGDKVYSAALTWTLTPKPL